MRWSDGASGKGGWDSGEIETHLADQATKVLSRCGKGGWDSGEIETVGISDRWRSAIAWKGRMGLRRD